MKKMNVLSQLRWVESLLPIFIQAFPKFLLLQNRSRWRWLTNQSVPSFSFFRFNIISELLLRRSTGGFTPTKCCSNQGERFPHVNCCCGTKMLNMIFRMSWFSTEVSTVTAEVGCWAILAPCSPCCCRFFLYVLVAQEMCIWCKWTCCITWRKSYLIALKRAFCVKKRGKMYLNWLQCVLLDILTSACVGWEKKRHCLWILLKLLRLLLFFLFLRSCTFYLIVICVLYVCECVVEFSLI